MAALAALPCVLTGMLRFGLRVPVLLATVWAAGAATSYGVDLLRRRRDVKTFWVMGLLLVCVLPPGVPPWMAALGMVFATLVGVEVFGGAGCYLFSPVLLGRYFLALSYPAEMTGGYIVPGEGLFDMAARYVDVSAPNVLTRALPLVQARAGEACPGPGAPSFAKLLLGDVPGCVGESAALAALVGGVFLLAMRAVDWRTVVAAVGSFGLLAALLMGEPPGWHLAAGGALFGLCFLAADPVTSPSTRPGRILYGLLIGVLAALMRRFDSGLEDVTVAILAGNMLAGVLGAARTPESRE
jgi:Na+-translocating ferredoxin:NAD+ oxidoreductase RnfD subunit